MKGSRWWANTSAQAYEEEQGDRFANNPHVAGALGDEKWRQAATHLYSACNSREFGKRIIGGFGGNKKMKMHSLLIMGGPYGESHHLELAAGG
jgi:hypothetical protein